MLRCLASCFLVMLALAANAPVFAQQGPQAPLPTTRLTAGIHVITAEVAANFQSQIIGLMFRESLKPNHGMLFVYPDRTTHCFWMRNTVIPLSVAFLDDDGTIVNVADMAPKSENHHCSSRPVRYGLEMEQGWFAKRGLAPGAKIAGLPVPGSSR
jgi:hypothetical protein